MSAPHPTTQTMKISDVRSQLNTLVNRVYHKETRVIVEKSGIPVAAIVSTADLQRLDRFDQKHADSFKVLDEIRAAFAGVSPEETERETDRITAEIRAESQRLREGAATAQ